MRCAVVSISLHRFGGSIPLEPPSSILRGAGGFGGLDSPSDLNRSSHGTYMGPTTFGSSARFEPLTGGASRQHPRLTRRRPGTATGTATRRRTVGGTGAAVPRARAGQPRPASAAPASRSRTGTGTRARTRAHDHVRAARTGARARPQSAAATGRRRQRSRVRGGSRAAYGGPAASRPSPVRVHGGRGATAAAVSEFGTPSTQRNMANYVEPLEGNPNLGIRSMMHRALGLDDVGSDDDGGGGGGGGLRASRHAASAPALRRPQSAGLSRTPSVLGLTNTVIRPRCRQALRVIDAATHAHSRTPHGHDSAGMAPRERQSQQMAAMSASFHRRPRWGDVGLEGRGGTWLDTTLRPDEYVDSASSDDER